MPNWLWWPGDAPPVVLPAGVSVIPMIALVLRAIVTGRVLLNGCHNSVRRGSLTPTARSGRAAD